MKTFLMAAAAYMLTFMVVMLAGVGALKAEEQKKEKGKGGKIEVAEKETQEETEGGKIEVTEEKTGEGSRTEAAVGKPLAGFSNLLDKALKKNIKVIKILLENHEKEQERNKQEQEDIKLLAEVMYHENWHTDKERKAAYYTGAVVMNRVKSKNWPNTVKEVVYQKRQYAVVPKLYTEKIPDECYQMAKEIYRNGTPDVPANVVYQATFVQGSGDWIDPINGEHFCFE